MVSGDMDFFLFTSFTGSPKRDMIDGLNNIQNK
uniref:Uncharacterized protein n=1 Tax=Lepeophtheirus salmonis TaxID=72036 RepID=A0A0K2VK64_LEPSM